MQIQGWCTPEFEPVRQAFAANLAAGEEHGATVSVWHRGQQVVDLYAGVRDAAATEPLGPDDLFNVWSVSKAMTATAMAVAVDRGLISYETPVASVWPAFGAAGKGAVTLGMLLSHGCGVCGLEQPCTIEDLLDLEGAADRLARQTPLFEPGSANAYNAGIFGHWADAILRRIDGRPLGTFFRDEVAAPLGADVWLGLPADQHQRRAEMIADWTSRTLPGEPTPVLRQAFSGPRVAPLDCNRADWITVGNGAAGGSANARGLARVFAMLAGEGELDGVRVLSREGVARARALQREGKDLVLGLWVRWAAGFILSRKGLYGPNDASFGHSGLGGSVGFADPDANIGFAYAMNRLAPNLAGDPRGLRLIAATYAAAGLA